MIPLHDDNPTHIFPILTITFISICVLVFLFESGMSAEAKQVFVYAFAAIPAVVTQQASLPPEITIIPSQLSVITSMFMHGGFMHLAGNMLYLWIFGNNVEDAMGHGRFIVFYLLCGVIATLAHIFQAPSSDIPLVGASGAISGVLGAYLLLYPKARVLVLIPLGIFTQLLRLPAGWVLLFWFAMQLFNSAITNPDGGGVAWFAHIGGFIAGMVLIPFFKMKGMPLFHDGHGSHRWQKRLKRKHTRR